MLRAFYTAVRIVLASRKQWPYPFQSPREIIRGISDTYWALRYVRSLAS